jgi:hypothetical protein
MASPTVDLWGGACDGGACRVPLGGAVTSLDQGNQFAGMTAKFHGGSRRKSRRSMQRKKMNRKHRKSTRRHRHRRQAGGAAEYPSAFDATLPTDLRGAADIASLDTAFGALPGFVGKYGGMSGGGRRATRRMRGGMALSPAPIAADSMLLPASAGAVAGMNQQFVTEATIVPGYKSPDSPYAAAMASAAKQQSGGKRRKSRKGGRKSRKGSRRH